MGIWKRVSRLIGSSGNIVDVNADGQLHVVLEGKVDAGNSSSAPLLAGGVFPGESLLTLPFAVIVVSVYSDVESAVDGLSIQQSTDGINWDHLDVYTIPAATGKTFSFQPQASYIKVVYTNGGSDQTEFRLQTTLKKTYVKPSSHRIQDSIVDEDDAELVKAVLTGKSNGEFKNVKTTIDGYLAISDISSGLSIAQGNVTGVSFVHKFGNAPDFDTSDGDVTIWGAAEDGAAWELMQYIYSTAADIDSISSSNGADNQEITIQGLDTNYELVSQTITLAGQARVPLSTNLIRVFRAFNNSSTAFAGHVIIYENTTLAGGIPVDNTKIRLVIDPIHQQTLMAVYTIPAGYTGYMRDWYAATAGASKNSNYSITLRAREFGKVFRTKHFSALSDNGTSAYIHKYEEPEIFHEKTDIEMRAAALAVGATGVSISAGFDIVLVEL